MSPKQNQRWPWLLAWAAWAVGVRFALPLISPEWFAAHSVTFFLLWAVLAIPTPFVAGVMVSIRRETASRTALVQRLSKGDGSALGPALELLAVLAKDGDLALGDRLAKALTAWAPQLPAAEYALLLSVMDAWRAAAGFGSGAFHGDGWASLWLMEKQDAVAVAARAVASAFGPRSGREGVT